MGVILLHLGRWSLVLWVLGLLAAKAWAREAPSHSLFLPFTTHQAPPTVSPLHMLLVGLLPDGYARGDADEGFAIQNVGDTPSFAGGWRVTDGEGTITVPDLPLAPGQILWCARQARAFRQSWGRLPQCEYQADTDPTIPNAQGTAPAFRNSGDELQLLAPAGQVVDTLVYGQGDVTTPGWQGPALVPYHPTNAFPREGQVYYRLFDPLTQRPLSYEHTREAWAQGAWDPRLGRRTAYPGWDLHRLSQPWQVTWSRPHPAQLLVAPDNILAPILERIRGAQSSILVEMYELTQPDLVAALADRARDGVAVQVLLEGAPAGGLTDDGRWAAGQLAQAGAQVAFMVNDVADAHDRYPYLHSKFAVLDGRILILSTENWKPTSMPADVEDGDTLGRRGYGVIIEDDTLAARAQTIFHLDADPAHTDIFPWQSDHPQYGLPQDPGYQPPAREDLAGYRVRFPRPFEVGDGVAATLFSAPEAGFSPLLALVDQAGPGDVILTEQLYEHPYWGPTESNPQDDPNVRLEALLAAARRGARVRILLDSFFDDPYRSRGNRHTALRINAIAQAERLDLAARLGNPTGAGLHAKLHLIALAQARWVVVASMNGGEASNKLNRELALALQTDQGYEALAQVFMADWDVSSAP